MKCAEGGDGCTALGNSTTFGLPFGGTNYTAPVNQGAVVAGVQQGDPAQAAGLSAGDVITSVNGSAINSPTDLTRYMNSQRVGEKATVRWVDPKGQHRSATLNFIQGPTSRPAAAIVPDIRLPCRRPDGAGPETASSCPVPPMNQETSQPTGGASVRYGDPWAAPLEARDPVRRLRGHLVLPVTVWTAGTVEGAEGRGAPNRASKRCLLWA